MGWACYVWLYIYRTSFLKNNSFFFKEGIFYEDVDFMVNVLLKAKRIQSIDKQIYFYVHHLNSVTRDKDIVIKNKNLTDKLFILKEIKHISQITDNINVRLWCSGMISHLIMGILAFIENELPERKMEVIEFLHREDYFPLKSYRFTLKQRRDKCIINYSPELYCYLKRRNILKEL